MTTSVCRGQIKLMAENEMGEGIFGSAPFHLPTPFRAAAPTPRLSQETALTVCPQLSRLHFLMTCSLSVFLHLVSPSNPISYFSTSPLRSAPPTTSCLSVSPCYQTGSEAWECRTETTAGELEGHKMQGGESLDTFGLRLSDLIQTNLLT